MKKDNNIENKDSILFDQYPEGMKLVNVLYRFHDSRVGFENQIAVDAISDNHALSHVMGLITDAFGKRAFKKFTFEVKAKEEPRHTYIKKSWTDDTGGGMMVDYVELHNGVILSITDESVQAYRNIEEVNDCADNFASMEIIPMPELSGGAVDTTIADHMEKRQREREAIFLAKCNDGGGRKPSQLPESHIREHWDLEESGDNGESLEDWLETCDVGDSWVNGTDELERIS